MIVRRFDDAAAFLERAEAYLLDHEARNNLALGISGTLRSGRNVWGDHAFLLVVEDWRGEIAGVAIRTPPRGLILPRVADPAALPPIAEAVLEAYGGLNECAATGEDGAAFASVWTELSGQSATVAMRQRIYAITAVSPPPRSSGRMRQGRAGEAELLTSWFTDFQLEAFGESDPRSAEFVARRLATPEPTAGIRVWETDRPVSMAGFSGPTRNGIRVGPVWTPPEDRRRGYATALVATLSSDLLASGRQFCFLYADRDNPTANAIYLRIGYRPVCDAVSYRFASTETAAAQDAGLPG